MKTLPLHDGTPNRNQLTLRPRLCSDFDVIEHQIDILSRGRRVLKRQNRSTAVGDKAERLRHIRRAVPRSEY